MANRRDAVLLLGLAALWGTSFAAIKAGLASIPPIGTGLVAPGLVLLAAVSVALGSVLLQRIDSTIGTEGLVAWSTVVGAVLLYALTVALVQVTTTSILAVVYLAVFAGVIGYFVYFRLLDRLGAIEIDFVSYAAPVFAALSGWLVLEETIDTVTVVGFSAILIGFLVIKRDAVGEELDVLAESERRTETILPNYFSGGLLSTI